MKWDIADVFTLRRYVALNPCVNGVRFFSSLMFWCLNEAPRTFEITQWANVRVGRMLELSFHSTRNTNKRGKMNEFNARCLLRCWSSHELLRAAKKKSGIRMSQEKILCFPVKQTRLFSFLCGPTDRVVVSKQHCKKSDLQFTWDFNFSFDLIL